MTNFILNRFYLFSQKNIIKSLENLANNYFKRNILVGFNSNQQLSVKGLLIEEYAIGGTIYHPIIYNTTTHTYIYDWKALGMTQPQSVEYLKDLAQKYQQKENMVFIYFHNNIFYEFAYTKYYSYEDNKEKLSQTLVKNMTKPKKIPEIYTDEDIIF